MILAPHSETIVWAALSIWKKMALVKWLRDSSLNQLIIHTTFWVFWLQVLIAAYAPWRFYHYNCNHWWSAYDLRDCEFKSDVAKCIQENMKHILICAKSATSFSCIQASVCSHIHVKGLGPRGFCMQKMVGWDQNQMKSPLLLKDISDHNRNWQEFRIESYQLSQKYKQNFHMRMVQFSWDWKHWNWF